MRSPFAGEQLTDEQLESLPTPRLLKLYKAKRVFPSPSRDSEDYMSEAKEYAERIKAILDTREHVPDR